MKRPQISKLNTWERYKRNILLMVTEALTLLREDGDLIPNEFDLNRRLFFCFKKVAYKRRLSFHLPTPDGTNPPYEDDKKRAKREDKRPDFYWQFVDSASKDYVHCDRRFVIECKRLGSPPSKDWILNENYATNGIKRFITTEHSYAKGDEDGAMIGYIENMDIEIILKEVNEHVNQNGISQIYPRYQDMEDIHPHFTFLTQTIERPFPVSPFHLTHYWIDLRENKIREKAITKKLERELETKTELEKAVDEEEVIS